MKNDNIRFDAAGKFAEAFDTSWLLRYYETFFHMLSVHFEPGVVGACLDPFRAVIFQKDSDMRLFYGMMLSLDSLLHVLFDMKDNLLDLLREAERICSDPKYSERGGGELYEIYNVVSNLALMRFDFRDVFHKAEEIASVARVEEDDYYGEE